MNYEELRALAVAAKNYNHGFYHPDNGKEEQARFIAAVSPDVVLGLLDELDAARAEVERHKVTLRTMSEWSDKLQARLAEIEKQEVQTAGPDLTEDERRYAETVTEMFRNRESAETIKAAMAQQPTPQAQEDRS